MEAYVDSLFGLYPIFKCVCNAYDSLCSELIATNFSSDNLMLPNSIENLYLSSKMMVDIIEASLNIVPIGVSKENYNTMVSIVKLAEWKKYNHEEILKELLITKSSYYRFKTTIKKSINENISILFDSCFDFVKISPEDNFLDLHNLYTSDLGNSEDTNNYIKNFKDVVDKINQNDIYKKYLSYALREMRTSCPEKKHTYAILKAFVENPDETKLKRRLYHYEYRLICHKRNYVKVNNYISDAILVLGVLIFGVDYLTMQNGYYVVVKNNYVSNLRREKNSSKINS